MEARFNSGKSRKGACARFVRAPYGTSQAQAARTTGKAARRCHRRAMNFGVEGSRTPEALSDGISPRKSIWSQPPIRLRLGSGRGSHMPKRGVVWLAFLLAIALPATARAAGYVVTATGSLATLTSDNNSNSTGCGTIAGDAYDDFCHSGSCVCITYTGDISGKLIGTDSSGQLHVTVDNGDGTPNCKPVYGELIFAGSKDSETIYLNGSRCPTNSKGVASFSGGWGTFSSSNSIKAFGTFTGTLSEQADYKIKLSGKTH
jgi:hypothetical protein